MNNTIFGPKTVIRGFVSVRGSTFLYFNDCISSAQRIISFSSKKDLSEFLRVSLKLSKYCMKGALETSPIIEQKKLCFLDYSNIQKNKATRMDSNFTKNIKSSK